MKKIFLAILISAGSTFTFAQTKTSETFNVTEASRQMYNDLQLNEAQYLKVRQLNQLKHDRMRDMEQVYRNDPQMMDQKRAALNAELDAEYRSVLRPDQFEMYLSQEGRNPNQMTQEGTEMKIKTDDVKIKSEDGESKVKTDNVKIKNEKDKYKYQDSRDNSKVKITDDKLKMEDKNRKIKVEDDKVKIKSRD